LNRGNSIGLRFEPYNTTVRSIQELLPLAINLKEISLINDISETLISSLIRKVMKAVSSKTLDSINLAGINTTKDKLQKILHPLKASLKKIKLQQMTFEPELFESFVRYISRNYSLEDVDLEDIWEGDSKREHEVKDPMSYWYSPRLT
jgi:hypothetical protein